MNTQEALDKFYHQCQERGLSPETIRTYNSRLKYFAKEYPELPITTPPIEKFLKARKETPTKRGAVYNVLQAFYSYLEINEGIKSPVPPRGPVGRPHKVKPLTPAPRDVDSQLSPQLQITTSGGGHLESTSTSISTSQAVQAFINSRQAQGVHDATLANYHSTFKPFIEAFPMLPFTPEPIEEYLVSHYKDLGTRWLHWTVLKAFYHFYCGRKKLYNPMVDVARLKQQRKVRQALEVEQLRQLLELDLTPRDRAIVMLLIDCGPRSGEIRTLTREQVKEGTIIITGKTGEHEVPIKKETHDLLVQLASSGPLFLGLDGPLTRYGLYQLMRRLLAKIGWTQGKCGTHLLRHSMGRAYVENGGDISSLKEVMGHTRIETTYRYAEMSKKGVKAQHEQHSPLNLVLPRDHDQMVQEIRDADPNLANALDSANQWLCRCKGCAHNSIVEEGRMEHTRCTHCGKVGEWFVINHINVGEGSALPKEPKEWAAVPVRSTPPEQGSLFHPSPGDSAELSSSPQSVGLTSGRKGGQ